MPFLEAYVQEVLIDPTQYELPNRTDPDSEKPPGDLRLTEGIDDGDLESAPNNSIIARLVSDAAGPEILAYPLMQNHLSLPVKAGEHVWLVQISSRYYWICRKNFNQQINDVSLEWAGRYLADAPTETDSGEAAKAASGDKTTIPKNQNPKLNDSYPAEKEKPEDIEFKTYWEQRNKHAPEVVPTYKKRPGDLVLQGSNNTLICLGTGGGHKKEADLKLDTESIAMAKNTIGQGTIDIVTGRGRYLPTESTTLSGLGKKPIRTSPYTIVSEFGYTERDKNIGINNTDAELNLIEGDPDFGFDASRIYISSMTAPDAEFSLKPNYPKIPKVLGGSPTEVDPELSAGPGLVLKSDNIRIVSRYHVHGDLDSAGVADGTDVNGNIRMVKEGTRDASGHSTTDGKGASLISMESDGTVMIDGATIVIGTGRETDHGTGDHVILGVDATEPMVLGHALEKLLNDYFTAMQNFLAQKFDTHIHPTGAGPSSPPTVTGDDGGTGPAMDALNSILSKIGKLK